MLRMMDYKEVNRRLRLPFDNITAVSPNNRCIWKSLAVAKGAVLTSPFNQASWADNRLLPVEAVPYMYLITFNPNNGLATTTIRVPSGTTPSYPGGTPSKNGYTFNSWSPTIGPATEDKTYTALWTENAPTTYTMIWNPNGGTWADADGTGNKTTAPSAGSQIVAPGTRITKDLGWAFDGWYNQTLGRDYLVGDTADGNYTFTAKWIAAPVLRAAVTWQTDTDGGTNENHLVHGDPNNPYETNDWLYGSTPKIPLNIRFEPLYKDENGNEIGYGSQGDLNESTEPIGYCGGNPFYVDDIIWNASYAQNSTMNQQYSMSLVFRTYNGSVDGGPTITQPSKGYGLAITVETAHNNDSMLWRDEIPVTYTTRVRINENGTYNTYNTVYNYDGTVYSPTINAVVYSLQTLSDHGISSEPSPGTAITGPWIH